MKTYSVICGRITGSDSCVRSVMFVIEADDEAQARDNAEVRLARMRNFPGVDEQAVVSVEEVHVIDMDDDSLTGPVL